MKIFYAPEMRDGEPAQGKFLNKYGVEFEMGKFTEVNDIALAEKLLTCPYFAVHRESMVITDTPPPKKKRGRPRKVKNGDESPNS